MPYALGRIGPIGLEPQRPHLFDGTSVVGNPGGLDLRAVIAGVDEEVFGIVVEGSGKTAESITILLTDKKERKGIKNVADKVEDVLH